MIYILINYKFLQLDFTFRFYYLYYFIFDIEIVQNIICFISDQNPNSLFSYLNGEKVSDFWIPAACQKHINNNTTFSAAEQFWEWDLTAAVLHVV